MMRQTARCAALALGAIALPLCGCEDSARKSYTGESIFEVFSPPTPQDAVRWAADPYDADLRYRGTLLLANAPWGGEKPYVEMYELAVKDGDPGVRAVALRALANHGSPEHAELAINALSDPNDLVRWEAARTLQRFYAPQSIPALIEHTNPERESSDAVRASSAWALGQYAEPRVVQTLIAALSERELAVNDAALNSLKTLTGQDHAYDAKAWLAWTRAAGASMFDSRAPYSYRVFQRDRFWYEWLPFVPPPPNETAGLPIGAPAANASPPTQGG